MPPPRFRSREEFEDAANKLGLGAETCAWVATAELVDPSFGLGMDISSEDKVKQAYAAVGNEPKTIEVSGTNIFDYAARICCGICEQELGINGQANAQSFGTAKDDRRCPIWKEVPVLLENL